MTVAAVILCADQTSALADAAGRPAVRRIAEVAWAGGAVPLVVVVDDPDGTVARALGGSEAGVVGAQGGAAGSGGPLRQGVHAAVALVGETSAVLIWPDRFTWVDAETVTSLIHAHGADPQAVLRPAFEEADGWPVLLPVDHLARLSSDHALEQALTELAAAGARHRSLALGDPGSTTDRATPLELLAAYTGPPPPTTPGPEWGVAAADDTDDGPLLQARRLDPRPAP